MTYEDYIASPLWRAIRETALVRDNFRCRVCDSPDDLEVHHRRYPEELGTETVDDLTTLCRACHEIVTSELRRRRYEVINALFVDQLPDYRRITPGHAQWPTSGPTESGGAGNAQDQLEAQKD